MLILLLCRVQAALWQSSSLNRRKALAASAALLTCNRAYAGSPGLKPVFEEDLVAAACGSLSTCNADALLPATRMLRVIELTAFQEQMLRRAAGLSDEDRFAEGLAIGPRQVQLSVELLKKNSGISSLAGCEAAVRTLGDVERLAQQSGDRLSTQMLLMLAAQFAQVRSQVAAALEQLPAEEQRDGRQLAAKLAASEAERRRSDDAQPTESAAELNKADGGRVRGGTAQAWAAHERIGAIPRGHSACSLRRRAQIAIQTPDGWAEAVARRRQIQKSIFFPRRTPTTPLRRCLVLQALGKRCSCSGRRTHRCS